MLWILSRARWTTPATLAACTSLALLSACDSPTPPGPEPRPASPITSPPPPGKTNVALGAGTAGSSSGWGGGSYPHEMVDGHVAYTDTWAHGLAFTGGPVGWAGEACGERQAVVDWGTARRVDEARVWHHGDGHVPSIHRLEYWDGAAWQDPGGTWSLRDDLRSDTSTWGAVPTVHLFPPVTTSRVRFVLDNCPMTGDGHGWIYEFEVFTSASGVFVQPDSVVFTALGDTFRLAATVRRADGTEIIGARPAWTTLDSAVVRVSSRGLLVARGNGDTRVVATFGGTADTVPVRVWQVPARIVVTPGSAAMNALGDTVPLTAAVRDGRRVPIAGAAVAWTSLDTSVAVVDAAGRLVSRGVGRTSVLAMAGPVADTVPVRVRQVVASLSLTPPAGSIPAGSTARVAVAALDSNGVAIAAPRLAWTSSSPAHATVNASGVVLGVDSGAVTIAAAASGVADSVPVEITVPRGPGPALIRFTSVPAYGSHDNLQGLVAHLRPSSYRVAVYIRVGSGWWTKPYFTSPLTPIAYDGRWTCDITTGGSDPQANAIAAFVVPAGYTPPTMAGGATLPAELYQNAVAVREVARSP